MRKAATLLVIAVGSAICGPASASEGQHAMDGFFQADRPSFVAGEPISATLVLQNNSSRNVYVFVPRGRAEGIELNVVSGPAEVKDMRQEPEPGLVGEIRIGPGETYRQHFTLSDWVDVRQPGSVRIACRVELAVYSSSLHDATPPPPENSVEIATVIGFTVLPNAGPPDPHGPGEPQNR